MKLISKLHLSALLCTAALTVMQSAYAAENTGFPAIVADDFKYVATTPSRWEPADWQNLGWATLAVAGTAIVADRPVRDFMRQQPKGDSFLNTVENFGTTYAVGVIGAFYLAGAASGNEKPVRVAQDAFSASLIAATLNQTLKISLSRSRPRDNQGIKDFQGYIGLNNNSSLPSGHTTEAFTLAAVIASHYEETWVPYMAYSVAGLVGVARMYHDAHFASDVAASAFIGTFVGKSIVNHNRTLRTDKVALLPLLGPDFTGVQLVGHF
ncbi:MAG: phosphatase PAP2 family protein [Gallionellaceae bacterium]|nr:MAG: phosphatase PAP2 family protein [Gallionellaceae bacterium]